MSSNKTKSILLRITALILALCWVSSMFFIIQSTSTFPNNPPDIFYLRLISILRMIFLLLAYIGGPIIAAFLTDSNPGAIIAALFIPVITLPILAFKGITVDFQLTKRERTWGLYIAVDSGDLKEVKRLVKTKVDLNFKKYDSDPILSIAYRRKYTEIFKLLLEAGADPNIAAKSSWTPLMLAAMEGNTELAELLITKGANINYKSSDQRTPLYIATGNKQLAVVRLLIESGADIDPKEKDGWTPLMYLAYDPDIEILKYLIEKKAYIHACNNSQTTSVYIAAANNHLETLKILIANHADIEVKQKEGRTPLMAASQNGHLDIVKFLMTSGADINATDQDNWTPLMFAVWQGHVQIVEFLLAQGANINASNKYLSTPLYIATANGRIAITKLLLAKGADYNIKSYEDKTALTRAYEKSLLEIIELLTAAGAEIHLESSLQNTFKSFNTVVPVYYLKDREDASQWCKNNKIPAADLSTEEGIRSIDEIATTAETKSEWNKVWAVNHQILNGYLNIKKLAEVPPILTKIGIAHLKLEHYLLGRLYLETARKLTKDTGLIHRIDAEQYPLRQNSQALAELNIPFLQTMLLIRLDASISYLRDRENAFQWHRSKGFPAMDHTTDVGVRWFEEMSIKADANSIWDEAWSGFHFALSGYQALNNPEKIAEIMWWLGRAEIGREQYALAYLYLETARRLAKEQKNNDLKANVSLDLAVLFHLSKEADKYQMMIELLADQFFPNDIPAPTAAKAAFRLFDEARKLQQWRDNSNKPIKAHQVHATGLYEVSLYFNRKLNEQQAVAFTLFNLGDIARELNDPEKAHKLWEESSRQFTKLGDQQTLEKLQTRLKALNAL